jgi:hypothetical protein
LAGLHEKRVERGKDRHFQCPVLFLGMQIPAELLRLCLCKFVSEWFHIAAWLRRLGWLKCIQVTLVGIAGILISSGGYFSEFFLSPLGSSILRDWLAAPLLMIIYWQAGSSSPSLSNQDEWRPEVRGAVLPAINHVNLRHAQGSGRVLNCCGGGDSGIFRGE